MTSKTRVQENEVGANIGFLMDPFQEKIRCLQHELVFFSFLFSENPSPDKPVKQNRHFFS